MANKQEVVVHWFRRDLRLNDNHALYKALNSGLPVIAIFIFDTYILDQLENRTDARLIFIHRQLETINTKLNAVGSTLIVKHGTPEDCWKQLTKEYNIKGVFTNNDYEPYARKRDAAIKLALNDAGITFETFKDQVIFEEDEIVKDNGTPYLVYTPYSRKWISKLVENELPIYDSENFQDNFYKTQPQPIPSLESIGFHDADITFPSSSIPSEIISKYSDARDFPSVAGTSRLSVHLRFGTVSIRDVVKQAEQLSAVWLNELCWREFYMMILWHFPHPERAFKPVYDNIKWRNNEAEFHAWCEGRTGYPIVDAGMRELNATGFMHNRVRMIVASFLCKHLLIDWRWGEAYFAQKLLDYELSSNNGGWQWAAGSGTDAAPYFRIFNPAEQTRKFDPQLKYISKWVPEYADISYPPPIVDHKEARERCLRVYSAAVKKI